MSEITYLTAEILASFRSYLIFEEKSEFTIAKYLRDVAAFANFLNGEPLSKELMLYHNCFPKTLGIEYQQHTRQTAEQGGEPDARSIRRSVRDLCKGGYVHKR